MSREEAQRRAELLKRVREQHRATVDVTQAQHKELQAVRKPIREALKAGPQTVPELAAATGFPADRVLWHVVAMKKYGLVAETGLDDGYYRYRLAEEKP